MKPKTILLGVVIALGLVAGAAAYQYLSGGTRPSRSEAACGYDDCDWTGRFSLEPGDQYPVTCEKCGRASVFTVSTCKQCGNQQILNELLINFLGREDLPKQTKCKNCGGPIVHGD